MTIAQPSPKRRRVWPILLGLLIVVFLLVLGSIGLVTNRINSRRREAMAEAGTDTPSWRWPALEKARSTIPDEQNSSWVVRRVHEELPKNWLLPKPVRGLPVPENPNDPLRGLPLYKRLVGHESPNERFDAETVAGLLLELSPLTPALEQTKPLTGPMMNGRNPLIYRKNTFNILLPDTQNTRIVARLLQMDAFRRLQLGDTAGALGDCRAIFNVGRSIGDEPFAISQLVRIVIGTLGTQTLQAVLAHGEVSDDDLSGLDAFLVDELKTPRLLIAARGERAMLFELAENLRTGNLSARSLPDDSEKPESVWVSVPMAPYYAYNQSLLLKFTNRTVEIAKQPPHRQAALWREWRDSLAVPNPSFQRTTGYFTYLFLPALTTLGKAELSFESELQCARTIVAAERFRLVYHAWPASTASLVPEFLDVPPIDPFNGQPLHMLHTSDGLVIYSVGPNLADDGGSLDPEFRSISPGHDFGYRLWNVDARHQPASDVPKELPNDVFQHDESEPR
jgi:hypothetical protein